MRRLLRAALWVRHGLWLLALGLGAVVSGRPAGAHRAPLTTAPTQGGGGPAATLVP